MNGLPTWQELMALMRLTWNAPREGAAEVLRATPQREAIWLLFSLVVVLTILAGELVSLIIGGPNLSIMALTILQAGALLVMAVVMHLGGRFFGGTGGFYGAVMLVTWLQFIFIFVQIAQVAIMVILPPVTMLVIIMAVGLFLWLLVNFVAELHGFTSLGRVLMGVLGALLAAYVIFALFAGALGIDLPQGQV